MDYFIRKNNMILVLVGTKNIDNDFCDTGSERRILTRVVDSFFEYKDEYDLDFIFINHPLETFLGFNLETDGKIEEYILDNIIQSFLYILSCQFGRTDFRVLKADELLNIISNLQDCKGIKKYLDKSCDEYLVDEKLKLFFLKAVNPKLLIDKLIVNNGFILEYSNELVGDERIRNRVINIIAEPYLFHSFLVEEKANKEGDRISNEEDGGSGLNYQLYANDLCIPENTISELNQCSLLDAIRLPSISLYSKTEAIEIALKILY